MGLPKGNIELFAQGDERAFRNIYDHYASGLRYFAAKYIFEPDLREDIIQEAFVLLWKKRRDFNHDSAMKTYLYRVVQSLSLNHLNHRKVEIKYIAGHKYEDDVSTFLDNILESEIFREVSLAFKELAPATRRVYELSLEGKKHSEIAEMLDISVNTIKKHKNNANHFLKKRLKNVF